MAACAGGHAGVAHLLLAHAAAEPPRLEARVHADAQLLLKLAVERLLNSHFVLLITKQSKLFFCIRLVMALQYMPFPGPPELKAVAEPRRVCIT